jgi:hypothetical protein
MKPRFLLAALAVACASHSSDVWAQVFLSDPRIGEGTGVKAGDFELHPGVAGEAGYDSNYFQRADVDQGPNPPKPGGMTVREKPTIGAYRLRVTPSLSFNSYGRRAPEEGGGPPPSAIFNGQFAASYNALFASQSTFKDQVSNQNHVAGTAALGVDILPERPWGADVSADYTRVVEASNDPEAYNAFRRDMVRARAGLTWRPGGGLFSWRFGYGFMANLFEDSQYSNLNNLRHQVDTEGNWKFLPRTALVYRGELVFMNFTDKPVGLTNGDFVRTMIGLNGLITNYLGMLVLGGWGATFFGNNGAVPAENFDSFIGQAELTWYPSSQSSLPRGGEQPVGLSSVALGYTRNFNASYLGNYYQLDRGYLNATYLFGSHFALALIGGLSHITRPPAFFANGAPRAGSGGGENRADATAFLEYRPTAALGINATLRYSAELTKKLVALDTTNSQADDLEFRRYQVYLGLRWFL